MAEYLRREQEGISGATQAPARPSRLQTGSRKQAERRTHAVLRSQLDENAHGPRAREPRVSLVVPTLNEAENLPHVFSRLPHEVFEVVLVDGMSTDGTVEVARSLRPDTRVIVERRRGKGNAVLAGFRACRGDIIVMLDADGSADPREIPLFVDALLGGADLAKGSRYLPGGGSVDLTRLRSLGNKALTWSVNRLYRTSYTDLCYGYNALWADVLPRIDFYCVGFEVETMLNLRAAERRLEIAEVPSVEHARLSGDSNLNAFRDGMRVLNTVIAGPHRFRRRVGDS